MEKNIKLKSYEFTIKILKDKRNHMMTEEELKKSLLSKNQKDLVNLIENEFLELDNGDDKRISNNMETLRKLDDDIIDLVIAKMDCIKSNFETTAVIAAIFTLLLSLVVALANIAIKMNLVNEFSEEAGLIILTFIVVIILVSVIAMIKVFQMKRTSIAIFFKSLLVEIKKSKQNRE